MMPATIRVGYRDYQIIDWPQADADAENSYGKFDKTTGLIHVRGDLPEPHAANVLLHEVLHAVYDMGELKAGDNEEQIVSVLANQLTQIFRDNPDLITYLNGANGNGHIS